MALSYRITHMIDTILSVLESRWPSIVPLCFFWILNEKNKSRKDFLFSLTDRKIWNFFPYLLTYLWCVGQTAQRKPVKFSTVDNSFFFLLWCESPSVKEMPISSFWSYHTPLLILVQAFLLVGGESHKEEEGEKLSL